MSRKPSPIVCQYCGKISLMVWGAIKSKPRFCSVSCSRRNRRRILSVDGESEYQTLYRMYEVEKMSLREVASFFNIGEMTILSRMKESGIKRRNRSDATKLKWAKDDGTRGQIVYENLRLVALKNRGKNHPRYVEKVERFCKVCEKGFYVNPSVAKKKGSGVFCSRNCVSSYYLKRRGPTSIDIALMRELDERGVVYKSQYQIGNRFVDIALPQYRIVIEADGDYWHSLPRRQEKDAKRQRWIESRGWKVFRFWGSEIRESPIACIDQVESFLTNGIYL